MSLAKEPSAYSTSKPIKLDRPAPGKGGDIPGNYEYRTIWDTQSGKYIRSFVRAWDTFVADEEESRRRKPDGKLWLPESEEDVLDFDEKDLRRSKYK